MDTVVRSFASRSGDIRCVEQSDPQPIWKILVAIDQHVPKERSEPVPTLVKSLGQGFTPGRLKALLRPLPLPYPSATVRRPSTSAAIEATLQDLRSCGVA